MPVATNEVTPTSPSDTYPIVRDAYFKGSLNTSFTSAGAWTSLPAGKRTAGMMVSAGSVDPADIWILESDLSTWTPLLTKLGTPKFLDSFAALSAYAATVNTSSAAKIVQLRGYHAAAPGLGSAFWRLDQASTRTVGVDCVQVGSSGAGRYIVVFENGLIDVTKIGARPAAIDTSGAPTETFTTETNAAFQRACLLQQDSSIYEKKIWVPASSGVYQVSQTITSSATQAVAFHIQGAGSSVGYPAQRTRGASTIMMMTSDTPIIELAFEHNSVEGLNLVYQTTQTSSQTNANCIQARSTARMFYNRIEDIQCQRGARGIFIPATGSGAITANNNTYRNIRVGWFSICAIVLGRSGTSNIGSHWYIQNTSFAVNQNVTINNVTKSGTQLTLTLSAIPTNLQVGSMVDVGGLQSGYNNQYFIKSISGLDVTVDMTSDPGGSVTDTTGTLDFGYGASCTEPMVQIGSNCEFDGTSIDIEGNTANTTASGAIALDNQGITSINFMHLEYFQPRAANQCLIRNRGPSLNIGAIGLANSGMPAGTTMYLVSAELMSGGFQPKTTIGQITIRDIANLGGTFILARSLTTANKVVIGDYNPSQTFRANATGTWSWGDAVQPAYVDGGTGRAAIGGTGVLEVLSGDLQTVRPLPTIIAANQALAREALGLGTPVGTMTGRYGGLDGYTSIDEGTTVSTHRILRTCTDLQLAYSTLQQPEPYPTSPASTEVGMNPFEVIVSIVKVSSDFTTEIGSPVYLRFQGSNRYWHLMSAAGIHLTEPARMLFTAGDYVRVYTYCNLIQSNATTITTNGIAETGQLTATSTDWPLNGVYGGTLVTNGINGVLANTGGVLTPATYNRTNGTAGGAIGITTPYGYGPSFIIGRPLDSGSALSTNAGICLIGDSILNNSIDIPRTDEAVGSGNGYFMRAVGHTRPVFRAATGGQLAQHLVGDFAYNLTHRGLGVGRCQVAYVALGTNDLFNGRTAAELQADLTTLFAMLRSVGYVKIITGSITPRTSSTDGWQTAANQTQVQVGFDTKAIAVNTWLAAQVGVLTNGHLDFTAAVTQNDGTLRWKNSTGATNYTVNGTPSTTSVPVSTALTASAWINYSLLSGTATRRVTANTTSAFTVGPAYGSAPTVASTVTLLRCMVDGSDNVHPTGFGHIDMAAVVTANISLFNL